MSYLVLIALKMSDIMDKMDLSCIKHKFKVDGYNVSHNVIISIKRCYVLKIDPETLCNDVVYPILDSYNYVILDFENYDDYLDSFLYELKEYISDIDNYKIKMVNIF